MTYITGTITDSNPGPTLYAVIAPALTTAGFTLVDTVVIATRTHKIWKSPAAGNAMNLDWYLDVAYTTVGTGVIGFSAFEFFDPATDLGYRGPVNSSSNTPEQVYYSRYGATGYALETNWFSVISSYIPNTLTATAFGYWLSITANRVICLFSTDAVAVKYAGFYLPDPLHAAVVGAASYPLISGHVGTGGTGLGLTRAPKVTGTINWATAVTNALAMGSSSVPPLPSGPLTSFPYVAIPLMLLGTTGGSEPSARWGSYRDVYAVPTTGVVVRGDTCTIDGVASVLATNNSSSSYAFKQL